MEMQSFSATSNRRSIFFCDEASEAMQEHALERVLLIIQSLTRTFDVEPNLYYENGKLETIPL